VGNFHILAGKSAETAESFDLLLEQWQCLFFEKSSNGPVVFLEGVIPVRTTPFDVSLLGFPRQESFADSAFAHGPQTGKFLEDLIAFLLELFEGHHG